MELPSSSTFIAIFYVTDTSVCNFGTSLCNYLYEVGSSFKSSALLTF